MDKDTCNPHISALGTLIADSNVTVVLWQEADKFYVNNVSSFTQRQTRYNYAECEATDIDALQHMPYTHYHIVQCAKPLNH
jgi:hypothetical protein